MARRDVEEAVEKLLEPGLEREGLELVDVEYVRERNGFSAFTLTRKAAWI